ncbi:translation initiation factor IF-2 [Parapedobacter pyrenivorans]|uniref:translation initiation factor IF-2 n=1 Tax=Parapedobacter pyrenivorans TaxID=1305674 RepID=UPI003341A399
MSEGKSITLLKAAKELNIGIGTAVDFLAKSGYEIESKPGTKLDSDTYDVLLREFQGDKIVKEEANQIIIGKIRRDESPSESVVQKPQRDSDTEEILIKNTGAFTPEERQVPTPDQDKDKDQEKEEIPQAEEKPHVSGMKIVGKIDLANLKGGKPQKETPKEEVTEKVVPSEADVQKEPVNIQEEPVEIKVPEVEELSKEPVEEQPEQQPVVAETPAVEPTPEVPQVVAKQEDGKADVKENVRQPHSDVIRARAQRLTGPNVVGRIDLAAHQPKEKPVASSSSSGISSQDQKRKRKRKDKPTTQQRPGTTAPGQHGGPKGRPDFKGKPRHTTENREEPTEKEIQDQIKATLARLSGAGKSGKFAQRAKLRRQKRDDIAQSAEEAALEQEMMSKVLKVTEFVTANDLANMMGVQVTQIIATCMSLGLFVSINQRLDAETIAIVADEFGYEIEFVKPEDEENTELEEPDNPENLIPRAPIVTVMGHVDHGKTSLLDYVRKTNVIGGEAGGITQHIGAYEVTLDDGRKLTFLDTPGHEAFTAMRARGAKVTDIAIIVIAADDSVMPQTKEAINHAQAAGVPIVFAFTKIDKPGASADKIREQLSTMNILVEDWGGKYQCQEISGKTGENVDLLLEKVLLEAEMLELTADPGKRAVGSVIEASLDKGRGIVTTVLIQSGTLRVGAPILAGSHSGKVKALYNERGQKVTEAGPATPVQILGMSGAPTAGDKFYEMESEVEARQVANKRLQLQREQGLRTQKHITLDEIGRRLAIGNFKELNVIVKGDVDGSIEALSDSLLKLSTEEIQVNVIHKSVGQISESDVLLASASDAIIIGFQVRPSTSARKLAEQEQIDIRLYSIIYDAIEEVKAAMEGMLEPKYEEKIVANVEIRETFKITKVGTIAGCMVLDGKINRNHSIRVIRDGVVVHTGQLASLKRFKDDVKEVSTGYECGLNIQNFNDIKEGDIIEAYEQVEVKRKL